MAARVFLIFLLLTSVATGAPIADMEYGALPLDRLDPVEQKGFQKVSKISMGKLKREGSISCDIESSLTYEIPPGCVGMTAVVGYNDFWTHFGRVIFSVESDGVVLEETAPLADEDAPQALRIEFDGVTRITLKTRRYTGSNHTIPIWGEPTLYYERGFDSRGTLGLGGRRVESPEDFYPDGDLGSGSVLRSGGRESIDIPLEITQGLAADIIKQASKLPQVKEEVENEGRLPIGVARFQLVGIRDTLAAELVQDDLTTELIKCGLFRVMEKKGFDEIAAQLRIKESIDLKKAQAIRKMTGAKMVLVGIISLRGNSVVISCRMMNTETGESAVAANVSLAVDPVENSEG